MTNKNRATWGSKIGFIFAAAGSAVGLANIWRFPYIVGMNGGAAFLLVYLFSLLVIGFPVLLCELLIGRTTKKTPAGAFIELTGKKGWGGAGVLTIVTGFLVSSFYAAVAGWILGYLFEAIKGNLTSFQSATHASNHFDALLSNPYWGVSFFTLFLGLSSAILFFGVRDGIERGNKIMMPSLFIFLFVLVGIGLNLPRASEGVAFLLTPDWSALTPAAIMMALGQSFFTLSLGQGTMVTYGSYIGSSDNLVKTSFPIILMDTVISLLASLAVFSIVFFGALPPDSGPGLLFHTLPLVFAKMPIGDFFAVIFFLLVFLAAITSQISAMEPMIAYLTDRFEWNRKRSVLIVTLALFAFGLPSALSGSVLAPYTLLGFSFLDWISFLCSSILIPIGGLFSALIVGWIWGISKGLNALKEGSGTFFEKRPWIALYFKLCVKYAAPVLIGIIFINAIYPR